ncbi:hypothetical protein [Streptomyces venetus]|uniref:hypothetical protein n=1 Tax=Streptomyces venetus TaxID=1701086 RepID=UPI003C2ED4BF
MRFTLASDLAAQIAVGATTGAFDGTRACHSWPGRPGSVAHGLGHLGPGLG